MKSKFSCILILLLVASMFVAVSSFQSAKAGASSQAEPTQAVDPDWWPMFHHDLAHSGYSTSTAPTTNQTLWTYTTGPNGVGSSPAVVNGVVYVGSVDDYIYALNAATGALVWKYKTGNNVYSSPAVVNGVVYVGSSDTKVYAIDAATGKQLWNYTTGGGIYWSSPAVAGGVVYVGSMDYDIYALNATTGALVWKYPTGNWVLSSPAVVKGVVYVGSRDGYVYALNATKGVLVWKTPTTNYVDSSPDVVNGVVYVGSLDGYVYALNATTGSLVWRHKTGDWVDSSPVVVNDLVYVGSGDSNLYALNATTGASVWMYPTGGQVLFSSPAVAGGIVYVGSSDNRTYALNAATGALVWKYKTGKSVDSSPAVANGVVYVGSYDGNVYAFGPSPDWPMFHHDLTHTGYSTSTAPATNQTLWNYTTGSLVFSSPAVANGVVYVGSEDDKVYALNASTGAVKWSYTTGNYVESSPAVADGVVFVGSYDDNVYAFGVNPRTPPMTSVFLNPTKISGVTGQVVNVTLDISNVTNLYAFQAGCTFNPLLAHCLGVLDGGFLGSLGGKEIVTPGSIDNGHGKVSPYSYALNDTSKAPSGSGALMIFEFQMVTTGSSDVHVIDWIPTATDGNEISTKTIDYYTTSKGVVQIAGNAEGSVITPPYAGFNTLETQAVNASKHGVKYNGNMSFTMFSPDASVPNNNDYGFLNVTIPKTLMTCNASSQWYLFLNGATQSSRVVSQNTTDTSISVQFTYSVTGLEQVEILSVYYWSTGQYQVAISATGKNVTVSPATCAQVTFTNITATGALTMNVTQPSSNATGLKSVANSLFVTFQTTATYHGNVTLQFRYNPTGLTLADQEAIRIWLWNTTSSTWRDITTYVNTTTDTVYGVSPHLSCFGITCALSLLSSGGQTIQTVWQTPSSPPAGLPNSLLALGYYNFTTQYKSPVTVRFVYNSSVFTPLQALFLQVWLWNTTSSAWVKIPTKIDTANKTVSGVSPHLSCFGITCLQPFPLGIAMVGANCSKTIVGTGYNVTINVSLKNQGIVPQSFTVFVYANDTAIYSKPISSLPPLGQANIAFNFNASLPYGNYSISACSLLINWVKVTIPGDVNGDGVVNILDVSAIAAHWLQTVPPGAPMELANADVNGDGVVNILDVSVCAAHWLQTLP